jgi:hypothetical protein
MEKRKMIEMGLCNKMEILVVKKEEVRRRRI